MRTDHNLIKDILPVYIKGETSPDSNAIIEKHLNECEECRELYELLLSDDKLAQKPTPYDRFEVSMKKIKRHINLRMVVAILLSVIVAGALFFAIFLGVVPASSTDVEITPEAYRIEDGGFGEDGIEIAFHLKVKDGKGWINPRMDKNELLKNTAENVYTIYNPANIPFDDNSDSFDVYAWYGFDDEDNIEKIRFHFKDKDVAYNIKNIIEEAGLLQ